MKVGYKGCLILGVIWLLVSLIWVLWIENIALGMVWLLCGMIELVIAFVMRYKEKNS